MGQRIRGTVTRVVEFGAFVELEPGIEGLIHVTEMSWAKKVRIASDVVKPGETVDAVVLAVNPAEHRISLGLKQALGDPWADVGTKLSVGSVVEGPVHEPQKFGAFIQVAEGIEGMVHISDMSAEKRLNHPADMLRVGQMVKAQVLAIDNEKRQLRLGMKQLGTSGLDEYIAEHKEGDIVTGRMVESSRRQSTRRVRRRRPCKLQSEFERWAGESRGSPFFVLKYGIAERHAQRKVEERTRDRCAENRVEPGRAGAQFPDHEAGPCN